MGKERNVFISHYHKDDEHIQRLKNRLLGQGYKLKNSSIDMAKRNRQNKIISGDAVKRLLQLRIRWAGVFICLIGENTYSRPWVDFEIRQAHKLGKKIIGVHVYGTKDDAILPPSFMKYGGECFGWNSVEKIICAIKGETETEWEYPDGRPRRRLFKLKNVKC